MAEVTEECKKLSNQYKVLGNDLLKENKYDEAILKYNRAIELDPTNHIFYSNRAQLNIKLENYGLSIQDCTKSIELDPGYLKLYYRRAQSNALILQNKKLLKDLKIILARQPNDKLSLKLYDDVSKLLKRERFELAILSNDLDESVINLIEFNNILVEDSYKGLPLQIQSFKEKNTQIVKTGITREYVEQMVELFRNGGKIPKKHAYLIVAEATLIFQNEPSLVELNLQKVDTYDLSECDLITVCGDTHGQFFDLLNIFESFGQITNNHAYLFNGDFVDRGSWSCEVALLLYSLKILYPHRIFINRGNHETVDMNKIYGFEGECVYKYSEKLYRIFTESFNWLPLATLIGKSYLVMHGGLFSDDSIMVQDINKIKRSANKQPAKEGIEMELLWTDPQTEEGRSPSKRGIGMQFGPDITAAFCDKNNLKCIIRSHEVRMDGVELEHNGRLVTVFSAPNYCDSTGNKGGVVNISLQNDDHEMEFRYFEAVPHPDIKPMLYTRNSFGM